MKRFGLVLVVGALLLALSAGVALAVLEENCPNRCEGSKGDNDGQDTLIGDNSANTLIGKSAADQLDGRGGDDDLRGGKGNDTIVGGSGEDEIFMDEGYDFVFAADDEEDLIDCNDEGNARIEFDSGLDEFQNCGDFDVNSASAQTTSSDDGGSGDDAVIEL